MDEDEGNGGDADVRVKEGLQKQDPEPDLRVAIGSIQLKNPVMVASGTFGFGEEYSRFYNLEELGAIVVKGLTLRPREGNPSPRIVETPAGMLNSIGLQNPGVDAFIERELPRLRGYRVPVIANISGDAFEDYFEIAERLDGVPGVAGLEVNVSCPNVAKGGLAFGLDPDSVYKVTRGIRKRVKTTVIVKLSPNVQDIVAIARAAEQGGADAVSLINTLTGMVIDVQRARPALANIFGGLSGPCVRPVAVRMTWQVAREVGVPVIGMGGIITGRDALEFIMAGASAVAVGTGSFVQPRAALEVVEGIRSYMVERGYASVEALRGLAWNVHGVAPASPNDKGEPAR
ncbi:MAG: dihydroorotate dehydrogenase [Firmicutes bacterium]|nr:dihydroorotate dehydrogenase [Bacillota bacterium]